MKKRFNWVDIVILGLILIIIYFAYSFIFNPNDEVDNIVEIDLEFRVKGLEIEIVDAINMGDLFIDTEIKQTLGVLIVKEVQDSYDLVETGDGRIISTRNPNRYDVFLILRGKANITDDYIEIGQREIRIGETVELNTRLTSLTSTLVGLEIIE